MLSSLGGNEFLYDGTFKKNKKDGFGRLIRGKEKYVGHFKEYVWGKMSDVIAMFSKGMGC